jgi:hypothetical protein
MISFVQPDVTGASKVQSILNFDSRYVYATHNALVHIGGDQIYNSRVCTPSLDIKHATLPIALQPWLDALCFNEVLWGIT